MTRHVHPAAAVCWLVFIGLDLVAVVRWLAAVAGLL
jgi:hypothetical protein